MLTNLKEHLLHTIYKSCTKADVHLISFQFYLVMKGHGKNEETSLTSKNGPGKFVAAKIRGAHTSLSLQSNPQNTTNLASDGSKLTDKDVQVFNAMGSIQQKVPHSILRQFLVSRYFSQIYFTRQAEAEQLNLSLGCWASKT